jgi:ketosteroid isomerase-like protein
MSLTLSGSSPRSFSTQEIRSWSWPAGGIARASGVEVLGRFGHVWTLRGGKIVHFKEFKDPDEALQATGLAE